MGVVLELILSFIVTVAFGLIQQIPKKTLLAAGIIGVCGRLAYILSSEEGQSPAFGAFFGAVLIALLAEGIARWQKMPVTVYTVAGFISLVPGLTMYRAMGEFLRSDYVQGLALATQAGLVAIAIAAGLAIVSSISRYYRPGSIGRPR